MTLYLGFGAGCRTQRNKPLILSDKGVESSSESEKSPTFLVTSHSGASRRSGPTRPSDRLMARHGWAHAGRGRDTGVRALPWRCGGSWHHRILLHQDHIDAAPCEFQQQKLALQQHRVLERHDPFPSDIAHAASYQGRSQLMATVLEAIDELEAVVGSGWSYGSGSVVDGPFMNDPTASSKTAVPREMGRRSSLRGRCWKIWRHGGLRKVVS